MNKNEEKVLLICPLFADVGSEDLSAVSARQGARRMDVKKGQTVLQRERTGPFVGVILSGALELVCTDSFGKLTGERVVSAKKNVFILRDASTLLVR